MIVVVILVALLLIASRFAVKNKTYKDSSFNHAGRIRGNKIFGKK